MQYQCTLRESIRFEGVGLHTGLPAHVEISPARAGTGLLFRLNDRVTFPANAAYIVDTRRATVLGSGEQTVSTVEHLLAALTGMGVDNATIAVRGKEIPAMDGSAAFFVREIDAAGTVRQSEPRRRFMPAKPELFRDGDRTLAVLPSTTWRIKYTIEYPPPVGTQFADFEITPESFRNEIASARTFAMLTEVEALRKNGLAKGGSLDNAIVFGSDGPLVPLRWANEAARHKVLDAIGDFTLLGARPQCEIVAVKSGHTLHCLAVADLFARHRDTPAAAAN